MFIDYYYFKQKYYVLQMCFMVKVKCLSDSSKQLKSESVNQTCEPWQDQFTTWHKLQNISCSLIAPHK